MLSEMAFSVFSLAQTALSSIGPFILLIALVVFIHELGHFLVARRCGVTVEVFSLGFGPKILKYQKGETLYCISLLPLGGYVKMFGDSLTEKPPESERHRGFLYQSVPKKLAIAFGGPLMNLVLAFVIYYLLSLVGQPVFEPEVGDVKKNTAAWSAGFRPGDRVLSLSEQPVSHWTDMDQKIKDGAGETLNFKIRSGKKEKSLSVAVSLQKNRNIFEFKREVGHIEGLTPVSAGTWVGVASPESSAHRAGLRTFDQITHINGKEVRYWRTLESRFRRENSPLNIKVKRSTEKESTEELSFVLPRPSSDQVEGLKAYGLERVELYLHRIGPKTPAERAGLRPGDRLLSVNGKPLHLWEDVLKEVQAHEEMVLSYRRDGKKHETLIRPEKMFVEGNLKERRMIGVGPLDFFVLPPERMEKFSLFGAVLSAGEQTGKRLEWIIMGLFRMAEGAVSPRNISGPVAIGRVAYKFFHTGFHQFLSIMALISLSLFFINLFPVPLLDGGHILFFTIEGIMGRSLDVKKLMAAQYVGLIFILSFFGFVFFNDISNWLNAW